MFFLAAMSSTVSCPSEMMPTERAMALAVMGWSPVTMMTLIPADLHLTTASGTAAFGGVNHRHESNKTETIEREVLLIRVKGISFWVFVFRQQEVTETKDTLSQAAQLHVGALKGVLPLLGHRPFRSVNDDGGAALKNPFRGAFHNKQVPCIRLVLLFVDRDLEFVGGVERNLADFFVPRPVLHHVALAQLCALEDSCFRGVTVNLSLQDADIALAALELSPVAETGHTLKGLPAGCVLVETRSRLVLRSVGFLDLVVKPHVGNGHPVLGEGSGLVGADAGGGAKGLHRLQILHKAVLARHPLGSQGEADGDSGKETLGHIGHNYTNEEDDGIEPVIAKDEGNDEEGHTKKDCDGGDDVNEVFDFFGNWCLSTLEARSEASNPSHHRVVTDVDHHPDAGAFHGVGGEEANVLSFQGILV